MYHNEHSLDEHLLPHHTISDWVERLNSLWIDRLYLPCLISHLLHQGVDLVLWGWQRCRWLHSVIHDLRLNVKVFKLLLKAIHQLCNLHNRTTIQYNQSINNHLIEDIRSWQETQLRFQKEIDHIVQSKMKLCPPDCLIRFNTYLCKEDAG